MGTERKEESLCIAQPLLTSVWVDESGFGFLDELDYRQDALLATAFLTESTSKCLPISISVPSSARRALSFCRPPFMTALLRQQHSQLDGDHELRAFSGIDGYGGSHGAQHQRGLKKSAVEVCACTSHPAHWLYRVRFGDKIPSWMGITSFVH